MEKKHFARSTHGSLGRCAPRLFYFVSSHHFPLRRLAATPCHSLCALSAAAEDLAVGFLFPFRTPKQEKREKGSEREPVVLAVLARRVAERVLKDLSAEEVGKARYGASRKTPQEAERGWKGRATPSSATERPNTPPAG